MVKFLLPVTLNCAEVKWRRIQSRGNSLRKDRKERKE